VRHSFENNGAKMSNILDLWHGTRTCNLISILKSGLLLPGQTSAQIAGAMFGPGIYGAPASTKSLNYSYGFWSRGGYDDNCFMFIMKMAMGNYYVPRNSFSGYPPKPFESCWAKSGQSGVINDECIVYKTSQVDLKYLLEFTPGGK
jgi:poly [ADP-ribose] polymerase